MEKRQRLNTDEVSSLSVKQEVISSLNPLLQPFDNERNNVKNYHERLPIFHIPSMVLSENNDENINSNKKNVFIKYTSYFEKFSGIMYSLLASLLFSSTNFIIQRLNVVLLDVFLVRFVFQGIIALCYIIYKGYHPFPNHNGLLLFIRSIIAASGSVFFYFGLAFLPLPDLMTLRYTQVVWTALLASIIFRERVQLPIIIASMLTLLGVMGVTQPSFLFARTERLNITSQELSNKNNDKRTLGIFFALLCAFSISMGIVLTKRLIENKVRQSIILFHFILSTFIMLLITQTYYWMFSKTNRQKFDIQKLYFTRDFMFATILATSQLIPMALSQKSIKREHPSVVTIVQASEILFAITFHNIFSTTKSNGFALIGSTLVLTSIVIIGAHKLWQDRKLQSHTTTLILQKQ